MRIGIFSNTYLPTISGVVRSISSYKAALEELGHEVHVFTQGARSYRDNEPNIHRYFSFNLGLPSHLPVTIPFSPSMDRLLKDLRLDVIHAQHPVLLGNVAQKKASQLGVPLVYTLHAQYWHYGVYIPIRFLQEPYNRSITKQVKRYLLGCDQIIAPSESMRNLIIEQFQVERPVTVIPTGVNLKDYEQLDRKDLRKKFGWENDFVIISTGRLAPEKNWTDLIQAAGQIIHNNSAVRLALLGDGPQRDALEQQAAKLGIADKVNFFGMVPYDEVAGYLVAADLFAFASLTETQGLGTLEAMAAGLPVAAYNAIGTRDVVSEGENGILTEAKSGALQQAIELLLKDPGQMEKLSKGALNTARRLDIRVLVKDLIEVYKNPMGGSAVA